jgi:hypothetical protein
MLTALAAYLRSGRRAAMGEAKALEARLTIVEQRVAAGPSAASLHELAIAQERVGGQIATLATRIDGLMEIVRRIEAIHTRHEEWLLRSR